MGMTNATRVGYYLEFQGNDFYCNFQILEDLHIEFEDDFITGEGIFHNILMSNHGIYLCDFDKHDEAAVQTITLDDINKCFVEFENSMKSIMEYLRNKNVSYEIKFGAIHYWS